MKMAEFTRVHPKMLTDTKLLGTIIVNLHRPKPGHKDFNHVIDIADNGDDFIRGLKTIRLMFDRYKAPRIAFRKRA